jgi:hypothetical protein
MTTKIFTLLVLMVLGVSATGQDNWELRKNKEGIQALSAEFPGSRIKAIKVVATFDATPAQIAAKVMDTDNAVDWISHIKSTYTIKRVSTNELYYYAEISLPWPVSNRDFVAHLIMVEDPKTGVIIIDGPVVANMIANKKGIVRINDSAGKWVILPEGNNKARVEYSIHVDPAGSLPAWIVNMFSVEAPMEIFENLRKQLKPHPYRISASLRLNDQH